MFEKSQPVIIPNTKNNNLFGILNLPAKIKRDAAIILLSPGIKNRVGPHRLYIKMADHFTNMGFSVLRVDPEGLGDSEGDIKQELTADVYTSIQLGRYISDTTAMMDWMQENAGVSSFILGGLCGGAITGLLAAEKDQRVIGILALGIPCILDSSSIDPGKYITSKQLEGIRSRYISKIFNLKAWMRFLSFKSDYKLLTRSLLQPFTKKGKPAPNIGSLQDNTISNSTNPMNSNLNPHFHRAFLEFISKRKIILIFSEADRLFWEFEEKYLNHYQSEIDPYKNNYRIEIISDANHVFSFAEWQQKMMNVCGDWLESIIHN